MTAGRYDDLLAEIHHGHADLWAWTQSWIARAAAALRESEQARDRLTDENEWMRNEIKRFPPHTMKSLRSTIAAGRPAGRNK